MQQPADGDAAPFDLNVGKVLEHWTVAFAIRELIANALDEQAITATGDPQIFRDPEGRWHVRDRGRGVEYHHLTQNESVEKRQHADVLGQFGMGLKDALAVFDRRGVHVEIRSAHGDIVTARRSKEQFADVVTLHAMVRPPADAGMVGTDVVLSGVTDDDIAAAKSLFLRYSGDAVLESTRVGEVLAPPKGQPARVYVKGLLVAEEPNFLFSYNITELNAPLRRALNRERSNVGRAAYSDRIKAVLTACHGVEVAEKLTRDLTAFTSGRQHDELTWKDVAVHACRVLGTHERVVFVTARQLERGAPQLQYAKDDGFRLVVVPDDIAGKIRKLTDLDGNPLVDLAAYRAMWNDSFSFTFVAREELTADERNLFDTSAAVAAVAGFDPPRIAVDQILISETMRLDASGRTVLGVYEPSHKRIVVRRDQLRHPQAFYGTLLHELVHASSGDTDGTLEFEEGLTELIGVVTAQLTAGLRSSDQTQG